MFTPRFYTQSVFSWRRNEPLTVGELKLGSIWTEVLLGYAFQPWMRVEGFYADLSQEIARAGGELSRRRIGVQVVTATPMRIR
jgi:hypothetical protein